MKKAMVKVSLMWDSGRISLERKISLVLFKSMEKSFSLWEFSNEEGVKISLVVLKDILGSVLVLFILNISKF